MSGQVHSSYDHIGLIKTANNRPCFSKKNKKKIKQRRFLSLMASNMEISNNI